MTEQGSDRSGQSAPIRASAVVAAQVKDLRRRRGLSATVFAQRCAELGASGMTVNVLANIETGRRKVTVDELLVFALVLDVAPVHLLAPATPVVVAVTDEVRVEAATATQWMVGRQPLPFSDGGRYLGYALERSRPPADPRPTDPDWREAGMQRAERRSKQIDDALTARMTATMRAQTTAFFSNLQEMAMLGGATPQDARDLVDRMRHEAGEEPTP